MERWHNNRANAHSKKHNSKTAKLANKLNAVKKNTGTRKTQRKNTRTKESYLLIASTNTPALSTQQKLQKGQRNTAKINKNNNSKKKQHYFRP